MLELMSTRRPHATMLAPQSRQERGAAHGLHTRLRVRRKDFVDFCEVPELGDVNDQDVLWLDQKPIVRGSPRRVRALASQIAEHLRAQDALGRPTSPVLWLERVDVPPSAVARVEFEVEAAGQLFCVRAFDDLTLLQLVVDGEERTLDTLPSNLAARTRVSVLVKNPHDVSVSGEVVLALDLTVQDAPASSD
jgi:hypothetical protein